MDGRERVDSFHPSMILDSGDCSPPPMCASTTDSEASPEAHLDPEKGWDLVVANRVPDLENQDCLPQAEELDVPRIEFDQPRRKTQTKRIFLCVLVAAAALLILLVTPLAAKDDSFAGKGPTASATTSPPNASSSSSATSIESRVLDLLPEDTLLALNNDGSNQAKSYSWLMADPSLPNYSDARIVQRFALANLYFATNGPDWTNNTHWLSYDHHECDWHSPNLLKVVQAGYTGDAYFAQNNPLIHRLRNDTFPCSAAPSGDEDRLYTHLWAFNNNLEGPLPSEMYLLTNLESVVLLANKLQESTLSSHISKLTSLEALSIMTGGVGGTIPTEIGLLTSLHSLFLFGNKLEGTIPSELGLLSDTLFADLHLGGNPLEGTLPSQIGSLSKLDRLLLVKTGVSGTIPTQLAKMERLRRLSMFANRLTGSLPSALSALQNVDRMLLHNNQLSGRLPSQLGTMVASQVILLENNRFSGSIPSELGLLTNLGRLSLRQNQFSGALPTELSLLAGSAGSLYELDVSDNTLSGKVADGLCWVGANATCPSFPYLPAYECSFHFDCSASLCGCDCPCSDDHNA